MRTCAAAAMLLLLPMVDGESVEIFPLTNTRDLVEHKVRVEPVEYKGRKAIRLTRQGEGEGLAILKEVQFDDGTIEADVAVKLTTPPGGRNPGFIGIAFRSRPDALHYDMFYIRPGNSSAEDQSMRNHSVQYVASPDFDWYKLRRAWPWVYEAHAELQLETWTHIKVEVEGRRARLFVNGASSPALIVDGLKGEDLKGGIGLWGSEGQESYFSNLRIRHANRQPVENGGEAGGTWEIKYSSDASADSGTLQLHRDGDRVSGIASGFLGSDLPVKGTWRNGYLELSFHGAWPAPNPGETTAFLAGWIDGKSAKGRLSVSGRADGIWTATRKD